MTAAVVVAKEAVFVPLLDETALVFKHEAFVELAYPKSDLAKVTPNIPLVGKEGLVCKIVPYAVLLAPPDELSVGAVAFSGSGTLAFALTVFPELVQSLGQIDFTGAGFLSVGLGRVPPFDCEVPEETEWTRGTPGASPFTRGTPETTEWVCVGDEPVEIPGRCALLLSDGGTFLRSDGGRLTLIECPDDETTEEDPPADDGGTDPDPGDGGGDPDEPGFYPAGVVAGTDLETVWNYQYSGVGRTQFTTQRVGVDALPTGASIVSLGTGQDYVKFTNSAPLEMANWDLTGKGLWFAGTALVTLRQCELLQYPAFAGNYIISVDPGAPGLIVNCTGDGVDATQEGMVANTSDFTIQLSKFVNFSKNFIKSWVGTGLIEDTYVGACMLSAPALYHGQGAHVAGPSTLTMTRVMMDFRPGAGTVVQGPNGYVFTECDFGPGDITFTADSCVFTGLAEIGGLWAFSRDAAGLNLDITMSNCAVDAGASGFSDAAATVGTYTGNYNLTTGASIDAALAG